MIDKTGGKKNEKSEEKDRNFHWKKKTSGRQSGMLLKKGRQ